MTVGQSVEPFRGVRQRALSELGGSPAGRPLPLERGQPGPGTRSRPVLNAAPGAVDTLPRGPIGPSTPR